MLFKQDVLERIARGEITLAYRRWKRPTVKSGGSLNTSIGLLRIASISTIEEHQITLRDSRRAGFASIAELHKSLAGREGQLYRIEFCREADDPRIALRENAKLSSEDIDDLKIKLARLDERSSIGPWTSKVLDLIAKHPERKAGDLATLSGFEKEWLKTNVRKLKNLGLTESLEVGYRLSPRGQAYLKQ